VPTRLLSEGLSPSTYADFLNHGPDRAELDAGFLGGLRELGGGLNDAGTDRIAEIRALQALELSGGDTSMSGYRDRS